MTTYSESAQRALDVASGAELDRRIDPFQRVATAMAYESDAKGLYEWSEIEASYGGGGYRIDRAKLAAFIAYALAQAANGKIDKLVAQINDSLTLDETLREIGALIKRP